MRLLALFLLVGCVAGAIAGGIVTPADLLKTRIQQVSSICTILKYIPRLYEMHIKFQGLSGSNQGLLSFATKVVKEEGASSLFRGWHTRMMVQLKIFFKSS